MRTASGERRAACGARRSTWTLIIGGVGGEQKSVANDEIVAHEMSRRVRARVRPGAR